MSSIRKLFVVGAAACVGLLTAGSVAWACSPSGNVRIDPDSGAAGSTVTVTGGGFETPTAEDEAPIEIRWNSTSGRVLSGAVGPEFSVSVTIPSNASGRTHYIVAVQREADGRITRQATAPFTVTTTAPAERSQPPADDPPPATGEKAADPAPSGGSPKSPEPAPSSGAGTPTPNPAPASEGRAQPRSAGEAPDPRTKIAAVPGTTSVANDAAPAAASTPVEEAPPAAPAEAVAAPPAEDAVVSSVSGDVWSGFADGRFASRGPSLLDPAAESSASSSRAAVVLGLVLVTITLMAGALWSLRTSRRVLVRRRG